MTDGSRDPCLSQELPNRNTPVQRVIKGAHQIPPGQKKGEIQRDMLDMSKGTWVGSEEVYVRNTQICMDKYTPKC